MGIRPLHNDLRVVNQEGVFTLHPEPRIAYENVGGSMTKYVFPGSVREEIRWTLRKLRINSARLFPSLEGVALEAIDVTMYHLNGSSIRGSLDGP
jgi:hypothetical protein